MEVWCALVEIAHAALGVKESPMLRSMRASHSNSALLIGSAKLLNPYEEEVVEMLWYNRCGVWNKKQSMLVSRKHFSVEKKTGRKRVLFVRRVCAQRACWRGEMVNKVVLRPCVHRLQELVVHHVVEDVAVEERAEDVGEKCPVHTDVLQPWVRHFLTLLA